MEDSFDKKLSFFYTLSFQEYFCKRFGLNNTSYIIENEGHYFNAPILHKNEFVGTGNLSYLPIPYYSGSKGSRFFKKIMKGYMEKLNSLGKSGIALRQDPCVEYDDEVIKFLLRENFIPNLFYTSIFDLSLDEAVLWVRVREKTQSYINGRRKDSSLILEVVDENSNYEKADDWFSLYSLLVARGNQIVPQEAFDVIREGIKKGTDILYLLYKGSLLIAGTQINVFGNSAYASACGIRPEYERTDSFNHYVTYSAVLDLKKRGFSKFELGPIFYKYLNFYEPSEKELSISHFKLGMGGELVPFFVWRLIRDEKMGGGGGGGGG